MCQGRKDGNTRHSDLAAWALVVAGTSTLMTLAKSLPSLGPSLLLYKMGSPYTAKVPFSLKFLFYQK